MIVAAAAAIFGLLTFSGCETTDPDNGDKTEQTGENGNGDGSGSDENDGSGEDSGEQVMDPSVDPDTDFNLIYNLENITITPSSGTEGTITGADSKHDGEAMTIEYSNLTENSITITYMESTYNCSVTESKEIHNRL